MRNYITKLNDRNLKRKRATGITKYVLYSLIALIMFKILDLVRIIDFTLLDVYGFTKLAWFTSCISFALLSIAEAFTMSFKNTSSLRILNVSDKKDTYFLKIIVSFPLISTVVLALIVFWQDWKYYSFNYTVQELVLFLFCAVNLVFMLIVFLKKKDLHEIINDNVGDGLSKFLFFISAVIFVMVTIMLFQLEIASKIDLILLCVFVFSIPVILERIVKSQKDDILFRDLENLEYEIYLKDLPDVAIKEVLQTKYMGFLVEDWVVNKQQKIETKFKEFEDAKLEIKSYSNAFRTLDKTKYPIEYMGRVEKFENKKKRFKTEVKHFTEFTIKEINEVIYNAEMSFEDLEKLETMKRELEKRRQNGV